MKNLKYIFVLVVVILMGVALARYWKTPEQLAVQTPVGETRELCYIWNTEAGDSATLRMAIVDGTKITGSLNIIPAEKDKKTGHIVGTAGPVDPKMMARTADLIWTASAEGMTNKEELKVIFGEGMATPGFGEMKLRESDGVYVYADPTKISYTLPLQQTDCGDPAVK
jgi:hypothetical protein